MELSFAVEGKMLTIKPEGNFCGYDDSARKEEILSRLENAPIRTLVLDGSGLGQWDSSLAAVLYDILKTAQNREISADTAALPDGLKNLLSLALEVERRPESHNKIIKSWIESAGVWAIAVYEAAMKGLLFGGDALHSLVRLIKAKAVMRREDFLFAMEGCTYKAVGIVALVSFMVGLILAFVGAIQLRNFGAQIYVASLVAIGMTRIMGAIMAGIIMAGRTGASYAATIGTMQVNEEIDALKTMGIPTIDFLVLPRIASLVIAMPFLTILADFAGIVGGMTVGVTMLGIPAAEYWKYSVEALKMGNFLVGVFHGFVYGFIIALCGCYYGIYSGRNADSVGTATTQAVVSAIVWMIVITGLLTFIFEVLGV